MQLRIADDEPVHVGLPAEQRRQVRRKFYTAGVRLGSLATYVKLSDPDIAASLEAHVQLAVDLGAPALRLFPGDVDVDTGAQRLAAGAAAADGAGVRLNVETHDSCLRGVEVADLLQRSDCGAGAIWDVLHTWRAGESPTDSVTALSPWLAEVQIKDVPSSEDLRPVVPGTGALPLREALRLAREHGFDGPVVFEHEAKWRADADPFESGLAAALRIIADDAY